MISPSSGLKYSSVSSWILTKGTFDLLFIIVAKHD